MKMLKKTQRLLIIVRKILKYNLFDLKKVLSSNYAMPLECDELAKIGCNLRSALESLGPIFIKFGQLLSTRHDMFPPEIIIELSKLQDQVAPFATDKALELINRELKQDYKNVFSSFNETPIASASVAQVYEAKLGDEDVVVKILRPDLSRVINTDLGLLKSLVNIVIRLIPDVKRFKPDELVVELERVLIDEQDLMREAANCSQLRRNFLNSNILYIPKVYWRYSTKNILVLEKISGISINNTSELQAKKVDLHLLAKRGVELFFTQVFEHCLFHGDLHPGNIFVNANDPSDPRFYAVDFGIMGSLGPTEQYYLASNLYAFLNRDYRKVAELHIESGWVDKNTRVDLFESAIRTVSEPILELPVSQISFGELLVKLFDVARSFNMQLQPQLLVFKKSLINVEGIAHKLDPDLDIWSTARPFIEKWMQNQIGINTIAEKIKSHAPNWINQIIEMSLKSVGYQKGRANETV